MNSEHSHGRGRSRSANGVKTGSLPTSVQENITRASRGKRNARVGICEANRCVGAFRKLDNCGAKREVAVSGGRSGGWIICRNTTLSK